MKFYITLKVREKGVLQTYYWGAAPKGLATKYSDAREYHDLIFVQSDVSLIYEEVSNLEEINIHVYKDKSR